MEYPTTPSPLERGETLKKSNRKPKAEHKYQRAIGVNEFLKMKFDRLPFTDRWLDSFGMPAKTGVWFIMGDTGSGKTTLALQIAKYLCRFGKGIYNSFEQGKSPSLQDAYQREGMAEVDGKFHLVEYEPTDLFTQRLCEVKSPDFAIIDSITFAFNLRGDKFDVVDYMKMYRQLAAKKLLIFLSHAKGKNPINNVGEIVEKHADVKITIQAFKAAINSRFGGGAEYIVNQEQYAEKWAKY